MRWRSAIRATRVATLALSACVLSALPGAPAWAQQVPPAPDPVPVRLDPATTAILALDISEQTCRPQPSCTGRMVPAIASFLPRARAAGVFVLYSVPPSGSPVLPEVAPAPGDAVFASEGAQDRFFNTDLDDMLRSRGITTIVMFGWRENGSVVYTSVGATIRGYTVVVADDATSAAQDYDVAIGRYQMLTQLNSNPTNEPLRPNAVTLSRTDLISFP
jgi:nicotinamidase-related amidase